MYLAHAQIWKIKNPLNRSGKTKFAIKIKRSFNALLGKYPSAELEITEAPDYPNGIHFYTTVGLPSELLLRRPDINRR